MLFFKRFILDLTVFVCGAVVMVYEIIGSRILAPFIGTSTYIWTSLIGVILAALSLGYWLGGKSADKNPTPKMLAFIILMASGLIGATILVKDIVLSFIASAPIPLEIRSLLAATLLFAPASAALGFVTPYAVKLRMASLADSGRTVGRMFAFSTVGSIAGTFAAGFFLIPFVGSVRTLYILAGSLLVLALFLVPFSLNRLNVTVVVLLFLGIAGNEFTAIQLSSSSDLHDIDTEYSRARVFRTVDPRNGKTMTALATDPYFIQSAIYLDSDEPVMDYSRFYYLARQFKPDLEEALMIGGAGYSFPREFLRTYPDAAIEVVEIDPQMTEIARRFFRLKDDPRMTVIHQDGRVFLNRASSGKYDVIFMDAFASLFSVPYQLTTLEAVTQMKRALKNKGVIIFNLGSSIIGPGSNFLKAEVRTYKEIFPNVYVFKVNTSYADDRLQNLMIVASKNPRPVVDRPIDPLIEELLTHRFNFDLPVDTQILTDDLNPVEYFNSVAQDLYIERR
jgi:spermidine synthase